MGEHGPVWICFILKSWLNQLKYNYLILFGLNLIMFGLDKNYKETQTKPI